MLVKKFDGSTQEYDPSKLRKTILRFGASDDEADKILVDIEKELYDGIRTKVIMQLMEKLLKKHTKEDLNKLDLRSAIGKMISAPDFEEYARQLLFAEGYEVQTNQVIQGHCVTHEIDGVATKNGETYYIETKHHSKTRIHTPFIVTLAAKAKFEDIKQGYMEGKNDYNFDKVIIICNTRLTSHANQYAKCVGLEHLGWKNPPKNGIEEIITRNKVYPVTTLKSLTKKEHLTLSNSYIITLNDLLSMNKKLNMETSRVKILKKEAEKILNLI